MPPRRSKKPAKESSSDSESGHEVSKPSIVSKVASKINSEDELAVAPVSPVKPRAKGKAKATAKTKATANTPRKTTVTGTRKSTSASARKAQKPQDEYDSSMRELTHSSGSPTPSEDSDSHDSADYDPKLDDSRNRAKDDLDESEAEEAALETMEVGSDALGDESDFGPHKIAERAASASPVKKGVKRESGRKSVGTSARKSTGVSEPKGASTTRGRKGVGKAVKKKDSPSEDEDTSGEDGPVMVGKIVKAPETGRVPPGQISQNTLDFLMNLQDPAKNDREWFKLHEPVFRLAEKEWVAFIEAWIAVLVDVDDEIPPLPPKDVIHRIYRDMRFSNDKTPYKRNFSASTSRSGRKGIFAGSPPSRLNSPILKMV
ncbi:hypothetical protein FRC06_011136 [Ceratobasidium sp. 370]|nr:hypothetical protein FRC06_011136 [Ceratobasidium sp. 370]